VHEEILFCVSDEFALAGIGFVLQSKNMNPNWAEENLQTIRTLMERSALYRRALAPIMILAGIIGLLTAGLGWFLHVYSTRPFCELWLSAATVTVSGAFLLARRQALKDREPFWSSPARRVTLALFPPLAAGLFLSLLLTTVRNDLAPTTSFVWILFYGCAMHSAGFFMPRIVRWFGLLFVLCSCGFFLVYGVILKNTDPNPNFVMGFFFGALHLACGVYLYLTEKGKNAV